MTRFFLPIAFMLLSVSCFSQANYNVTDPEKNFKEAKEFFIKGEYSLAYPLLKPLLDKYPENTTKQSCLFKPGYGILFYCMRLETKPGSCRRMMQSVLLMLPTMSHASN